MGAPDQWWGEYLCHRVPTSLVGSCCHWLPPNVRVVHLNLITTLPTFLVIDHSCCWCSHPIDGVIHHSRFVSLLHSQSPQSLIMVFHGIANPSTRWWPLGMYLQRSVHIINMCYVWSLGNMCSGFTTPASHWLPCHSLCWPCTFFIGLVEGDKHPPPHLCTAGIPRLEYPQPVHRQSGCHYPPLSSINVSWRCQIGGGINVNWGKTICVDNRLALLKGGWLGSCYLAVVWISCLGRVG